MIFGCFLKPVNSVGYLIVRSHYRLSYGGIYKCWHLPIFPGRHQPSIFGTTELNFCVRDGNRWTLSVINTNLFISLFSFFGGLFGDPCGTRTRVAAVRGRSLNRLTNGPIFFLSQSWLPPALSLWCAIRDSNPGHPD